MNYMEELLAYQPLTAEEQRDRETMLAYMCAFPDNILGRENVFAHMTGSSMILNETGDKVLMIYHNIYQSWSWTGGHADGEEDMLQVALREAREETGVETLTVLGGLASADVLPVQGHWKRGSYVSAHVHLNYAYLFVADESEPLRIKEDENSQVGWISVDELEQKVTEQDMIPLYRRLIAAGQKRLSCAD